MPRGRLAGSIALVACLLSLAMSDDDVASGDGCATAAFGTSAAGAFAACATAGSAMLQTAASTNALGGGATGHAPAWGLGAKASTTTIPTLTDAETSFAQWMQQQWPKFKRIKSILMFVELETQGGDKLTTWPLYCGVTVVGIGAWMIGQCCARRSASFGSTLAPMGQSNPSALATAGSRSRRLPCADACM
mmetsp:Transcript_106513/g.270504  ORF Transcript_106513/g.270504 Transcript_106513/m.270504 type:complete len:191 (+) Transcript_106513:141-713(+)